MAVCWNRANRAAKLSNHLKGLSEVFQAAHLPSEAFDAAKLWCIRHNVSSLNQIANRFEEVNAAVGLKPLEARRLEKILAALTSEADKGTTPLRIDVKREGARRQ